MDPKKKSILKGKYRILNTCDSWTTNLQQKLDLQFKLEESSDMSWPILFKILGQSFLSQLRH
jgi:hypothetical protein